jgi:hypothetical protein
MEPFSQLLCTEGPVSSLGQPSYLRPSPSEPQLSVTTAGACSNATGRRSSVSSYRPIEGPSKLLSPSLASRPVSSASLDQSFPASPTTNKSPRPRLKRSSLSAAPDLLRPKRSALSSKRVKVVEELIETERGYLSSLEAIQSLYVHPLATIEPPILDKRLQNEVFSNFSDILGLSTEFYRALQTSNSGESNTETLRIGQTLLPLLPFLKLYSVFVSQFSVCLATLDREDKVNPAWRSFTTATEGKKGLGLAARLLGIVQRVPRYRLLLGDLLKRTSEADPDFVPLRKAYSEVEKGQLWRGHLPNSYF